MTRVAQEGADTAGPLTRMWTRLRGPAALGLWIRIGSAGVGYLLQIALARLLGVDEYGVFALAWVWLTVGGFLGCLGFSQAAVKFLPTYEERREGYLRTAFIRTSRRVTVVTGLTLALLAAAAAWMVTARSGYPLVPFLLMAACLPVFAYQDLMEGYGRSLGRTDLALVPPFILRPVLLMVLSLGAIAVGARGDATTAMAAGLAATSIACLVQHVVTMRAVAAHHPAAPSEAKPADASLARREWFRTSIVLWLIDGAQALRGTVDMLLLALFVSPATLAVYFAATRVASLLGFVEFAVSASAAHGFARLKARDDIGALRRAVFRAGHTTFWPTAIGAVALTLVAPLVLRLFGPEFGDGSALVGILSLAFVIRSTVGPADDVMIMLGVERWALVAHLLGLVTSGALIVLLVPVYGTISAAAAMVAAALVTTAGQAWIMQRSLPRVLS